MPQIDVGEILGLSDRVIRILQRVAPDVSHKRNVAHEGVRMEAVGRVLRALRTKKSYLESLANKSLENIKRLMYVAVAGA